MRNGYKAAEILHLSSIKVFGICGSSLKQLVVNGKAVTGKAEFNHTKRVSYTLCFSEFLCAIKLYSRRRKLVIIFLDTLRINHDSSSVEFS